jgi:predicted alpha/beta hydrolase family esterase
MKTPIIVINWWQSKEDFKSFEESITKWSFHPDFQHFQLWTSNLHLHLPKDKFDVMCPEMPNNFYAEYKYWKLRFEQTIPFLNSDVILIAHSLWGWFLTKYLNENEINFDIKHIFLVSATFKDGKELMWDFNFDKNLINFKKYWYKTTFIHAYDDDVVDFSDFEDFKIRVPNARFIAENVGGHFVQERLPLIEKYIKELN